MIAGAGGLDVCLLVVAANEGVMPQTREHLAVAELVGVRSGVIAMSKCDLAGDEVLALAIEEVRETVAQTCLRDAEIVAVSARTGQGIDALREALTRAPVPPRASHGPVLLPIDRVFVRKGFGTVVTGTLVSGSIHEGDSLVLAPVGIDDEQRDVRVRALQVHGEPVLAASAGTRLAVNIVGIESIEVPRGAWLMRKGELALSYAFDAELSLLASTRHPLGRRSKLELAVGTAHTPCTVSLLEGETLEPGSKAIVRITTQSAVVLRPNERFVLRGPPSLARFGSTLGGGVVIRPVAERVKKRDIALARAKAVAQHADDREARLRAEADAAGLKGLSAQQLATRVGAPVDDATLIAAGLVQVAKDRWVSANAAAPVAQKILQALSAAHSAHPASRGLSRTALRSLGDDALIDALLAKLVAERKVQRDQDVFARAGWKPKNPDAVAHLEPVRQAICSAGLMPPRVDELAKSLHVEPKALMPALERLVARGDIVKISPEFYADAASILELEKKLVAWIEAHGSIDAQGFKTLTGASRKWAIPIAEYFDGKKVTIRIGDVRKLRAH